MINDKLLCRDFDSGPVLDTVRCMHEISSEFVEVKNGKLMRVAASLLHIVQTTRLRFVFHRYFTVAQITLGVP